MSQALSGLPKPLLFFIALLLLHSLQIPSVARAMRPLLYPSFPPPLSWTHSTHYLQRTVVASLAAAAAASRSHDHQHRDWSSLYDDNSHASLHRNAPHRSLDCDHIAASSSSSVTGCAVPHSPAPEEAATDGSEIDPRYGVEKRLVPTGPNPLHN